VAHFIPERRLSVPNSDAERKVLEWLAALDDDWTVLHSVGITAHAHKPWAEADAVLVGPPGVLILEVKGGRVERRAGLWGFWDRFDQVTWKAEGPYAQAGGAAAALRRDLVQAGALNAGSSVHWAVLLPDVVMPAAGPEVLPEATLDASDRWGSPEVEVHKLFKYWRTRVGGVDLDPAQRQNVVQRIRGDFDLVPLARLTASNVLTHQQRLTGEQQQLVEAVAENPRVLIQGRAGTGKSALAVNLARRAAAEGRVTAFVVYNSALRLRVAAALVGTGVDVVTVDGLAWRIARCEEPRLPVPTDAAGWTGVRRSAARSALSMYDTFVLDEAQDLDAAAQELLDRVLVNGLRGGHWVAFRDSEQDIFHASPVGPGLEAGRPVMLRLSRNCRSTKQILTATSLLCRIALDVETPVMGPEVSFTWCSGSPDHEKQLEQVLLAKVAAYGADNVLLVGRRGLASSVRARLARASGVAQMSDVREGGSGPFVATTSSAKGLEAQCVIVYGVDELRSPESRRFLYTACSRAQVDLTVILQASTRPEFEEGAAWLGEQLRSLVGSRPV
jgi:hypothetical protein